MEKIKSFTIDHIALEQGFYLSNVMRDIYTYDLRFKRPNQGDYLSNDAIHSIEHLFATIIRNSEYKDYIIYFGPMGCRTGFYLLTKEIGKDTALSLVKNSLFKCLEFNEVPGSKIEECGNYLEHNLLKAQEEIRNYLGVLSSID